MLILNHCRMLLLGLLLVLHASCLYADTTLNPTEPSEHNDSGLSIGKKFLAVDHYTLPKGTTLNHDMVLVADTVDLQGDVVGRLRIIAVQVKLAGNVKGSMSIVADHVNIQPTAVIDGQLDYVVSSLELADEAQINGRLHALAQTPHWHEVTQRFPWFLYGSLFILGAIALSFRGFSGRLAASLSQRPWLSLVCGVVLFFLTPWLILTTILSVIGIPLSLLLLSLYALGLCLACVYTAWIMGNSLISLLSKGEQTLIIRLLALALGLAIFYYVGLLPIFGKLFRVLALCIGLGGIALTMLNVRGSLTTTEKTI